MNRQIYLDYNASTPIAPEVLEAMTPFLHAHYGNPSSPHWAAAPARDAMARARKQIAELLGCEPGEIVFTSGGSEANNLALKGLFWQANGPWHAITSAVEHPSIVEPFKYLARLGAELTVVPVDRYGTVDPDDVRRAINSRTRLITVMHANNEVGAIQPIAEISQSAREHGILLHTDAAQTVGKIPTRVDDLGVDLLSVAGHKLYAPKGVGALYVKSGVPLVPLIHGAGHESARRAGTENTPHLVALGAACDLARQWVQRRGEIQRLRDYFWDRLRAAFADRIVLNGHPADRLPNTLNVSFPRRGGAEILASLAGVAASTGSACHSGSVKLSPVLEAMGISAEVGMGAIRFSLGRSTARDELDTVVERLVRVLG